MEWKKIDGDIPLDRGILISDGNSIYLAEFLYTENGEHHFMQFDCATIIPKYWMPLPELPK
jgi:hypothetical protein